MHKLEELLEGYCERIEKELGDLHSKISKNETVLPPQDLDTMDKLLHSLKSVKTVMAMIEHEGDYYPSDNKGYSGRYYEPRYTTPRYSGEDYSGRRMGRGYSRDSRDNDSVRILEGMMSRARTEGEAMAIQEAINAVNRMEG